MIPTGTPKNKEFLDSLANGLHIIQLFASGVPTLTIQDAAQALNITRAAARRLLLTLEELGYIHSEGRNFSLSVKVLELGYAYFASMSLPTLAQPAMRTLSDKLGQTCSLGILESDSVVFLAREEPKTIFRLDLSVGRRLPAYAHSLGRVLLSGLNDEELDHYFQTADIRKLTAFTLSKAALKKAIQQSRKEAYSVVLGELVDGFGGVAVPLHNKNGEIIAGIGVSMVIASRSRDDLVKALLPALRTAAHEIEKLLHALER